MQVVLILLVLAGCGQMLQPCEPFGLRIYYGDILLDHHSAEKAVIYFNTQSSCSNSFINVISAHGFKKILCENTVIETSAYVNYYTAYIHSCTLRSIPFDEKFSYIAFGWDQKRTDIPTPHANSWVLVELIDPVPKERTVRVAALADWGKIENNIGYVTPILPDLKRVVQDGKLHALIIAGDIAYDLDSNYGDNYEEFLQLLQQVSATLPIFHIPGNHERKNPDAALLFNATFKIYGLQKNLATGLSFGSLFIVPFDAYNIVYSKPEEVSSLAALQKELVAGAASGRFVLPCSHYPLICSGEVSECQSELAVLKPFFEAMIDSGVSLYVGAHTHSYERNYPYTKDGSFLAIQSPYQADAGYLLSVVEGVGGNDVTIVEYLDQQAYTAAYTVNETGFGVIESTQQHVTYSHYSTKQGFMDEITIVNSPPTEERKKIVHLNMEEASS